MQGGCAAEELGEQWKMGAGGFMEDTADTAGAVRLCHASAAPGGGPPRMPTGHQQGNVE